MVEEKKEETKAVEEKAEGKIQVSFNLRELEDLSIFLSRLENARGGVK